MKKSKLVPFAIGLTSALSLSCGESKSDSTNNAAADTTAPVAGGGLAKSSATSTSIKMKWTAATDDKSEATALVYTLFRSSSDNIKDVAGMEANGTKVGDGAAAVVEKEATGLTAQTTYYFNVLVTDAAGNKSAYTSVSVATLDVLAGTSWKVGCTKPGSNYEMYAMTIGLDGTYSQVYQTFPSSDPNCTPAQMESESKITGTYIIEGDATTPSGAKKWKRTFTSVKSTIKSDAALASVNGSTPRFCGKTTDWVKNEEVDITSMTCDGHKVDDPYYDLFKVDGTNLNLGQTTGLLDGSSDAKRPTELETAIIYKKQ